LRHLPVIALLALLAASGCGSSGQSSERDRADAASYVRAAGRFLAVRDRAKGEAFTRVQGAFDRCFPSVGGRTRLLVSQEAEEFLVPVGGQLALAGYRDLSTALASVDAHDDGLRQIARATATIVREDEKLGGSELDFCGFLAAWHSAAWSEAFPDAYFLQLCRAADYGRDEVARAEVSIRDQVLGLGRLGLSQKQELDLYTSLLSSLFAVCSADR